jgi:large subunit ribosomal protein L19
VSDQKNDKEVTPDAESDDSVDKNAEEVKKAEEVKAEAVKEGAIKKEESAKSDAQPESKQAEPTEENTESDKGQAQEAIKETKGPSEEEAEKSQEGSQDVKEEIKAQGFQGDFDFYSRLRDDLPEIKSGDIIQVSYRVIEGGKERTQLFEGTVIAIKNKGIAKTITVRKTSFGIAVERIFPLNSKLVQKIVIKRHSKVRRAKLYFLRKLKGKAARLKELR